MYKIHTHQCSHHQVKMPPLMSCLSIKKKKERQNLVQTKINDRYILCQQEQTSLSSQVNRCLKQTNEKKEERRSHNRSLLNPRTCFGRLYMLQLQYWSSSGGRGGGYCHLWPIIGICHSEGYGFQAVYSGIGYVNQRVWVQNRILFCTKPINCLKIIVYTTEIGNRHSKIYKNQIGKFKYIQHRLKYRVQKFS